MFAKCHLPSRLGVASRLARGRRVVPKRKATSRVATVRRVKSIPRTGSRLTPFRLCAVEGTEGTPSALPDLPLFKQLATDLASLDKALVRIHDSRQKTTGKVDESLLTTLIEEVQREQEAWFKQVQVMERLVEQAATLESSKTELQEMQQQYEEMRRKVDLYYGLLEEREREVDSLKQQLEDVNSAAELKERKNAALKELVVAGTTTSQEEMGLPTWSPSQVSTFFVKEKDEVIDVTSGERESAAPTRPCSKKPLKRVETPGLAFVSIFLLLTRFTSGVWKSTTHNVPREVKALVELAGLAAILVTAAAVASTGFM